jgi:hypothetical protein
MELLSPASACRQLRAILGVRHAREPEFRKESKKRAACTFSPAELVRRSLENPPNPPNPRWNSSNAISQLQTPFTNP